MGPKACFTKTLAHRQERSEAGLVTSPRTAHLCRQLDPDQHAPCGSVVLKHVVLSPPSIHMLKLLPFYCILQRMKKP